MCNKNKDNFTLYSKSLLTTLNISAVIVILDRTHLTCVSSCWCWHLRRIKPMWDLKQVHGVKRRKQKKNPQPVPLCERYSKTVIYPEAARTWIQLSRTNWGEPHKSTFRKALRIMFLESRMPVIQTDGAVCAWESCESRRLRAVKGRKFPLRKHWLTPSFSTV